MVEVEWGAALSAADSNAPISSVAHPTLPADAAAEVGPFKEGGRLVSFLYPAQNKELVEKLAAKKMTVLGEFDEGWQGAGSIAPAGSSTKHCHLVLARHAAPPLSRSPPLSRRSPPACDPALLSPLLP